MTPAGGDDLRLLGLDEAAKLLGTHRDNLRRWIDTGALPALFVGDGLEPRVSRLMLAAWQERTATAEPRPRAVRRRRGVA